MGATAARPSSRNSSGLLLAVNCLHKPRRETPRHESGSVDDFGHCYPERVRHHSLFLAAAIAPEYLSPMRTLRAGRLQLLSSLQLQAESKLSAVPEGRGGG